jgi:hypothetical protein
MSLCNNTIIVFERYQKILREELWANPIVNLDDPTSFNHLLWMCEETIYQLKNNPSYAMDKAHRWLGYIQGCLVCKNVIKVETERNFTRPLFTNI